MKIFVISVIRGFEPYREAAARAARALRHEVKRAEDFTASSATPQQACLAGVRWADTLILVLGARYGEPQASGLSPTHEEYREARERCRVLVFLEQGAAHEPAQGEFVREVRSWTTGHYTAVFSDVDELRDAVTAALRDLELSQATGPVDEGEMLARGRTLLPERLGITRRASRCLSSLLAARDNRCSDRERSRSPIWKKRSHARRCSVRSGFSTAWQGHGTPSEKMRLSSSKTMPRSSSINPAQSG